MIKTTGSIEFTMCQKLFKHFTGINSLKSHNTSVMKVQLLILYREKKSELERC